MRRSSTWNSITSLFAVLLLALGTLTLLPACDSGSADEGNREEQNGSVPDDDSYESYSEYDNADPGPDYQTESGLEESSDSGYYE